MKNNQKSEQPTKASIIKPLQTSSNFNGPKQRWPSRKVATTDSLGPASETMNDCEDIIEDDYDSYDELFTQHFTDENVLIPEGREPPSGSRDGPRSQSPAPRAKGQQKSVNGSRRFLLPSASSAKTRPSTDLPFSNEDGLPWAQRYAPRNLDELAVHKRKVRDVESWLIDALAGRNPRRLLVLKGPAGSGKTTTISLLSHKLKFDILEWKNPWVFEYATKEYVSLGSQFDEFLSRGYDFGGLALDGDNGSQESMEDDIYTSQRRIILIEEFPTLSARNSSALTAFRLSLLRYVTMNTSPARKDSDGESGQAAGSPIVMIVSETFSNSETFDNLTVHRLLGREIYNHPSTTIIEFNTIAPTFMDKALKLVLEKNGRYSKGNAPLASSLIESISKIGDIRNAIASLEFVCLGIDGQSSRGNHTFRAKKSSRARNTAPPVDNETTKEIGHREGNLGLFHAVGKVVYNKRDIVSGAEHSRQPSPPDHLRQFYRPGVSQVSVNDLVDETGTDIQSFISALHENYVPSCHGPSFTECLDGCIDALSDSDVLCVDRKGHGRFRAGFGTGTFKSGASVDLLRQDEISYQVAARGLLFALPSPVKRQISASKSKRPIDSYKMFFPPTVRLLHQMEEVQGLVDSWKNTLLNTFNKPNTGLLSDLGRSTHASFARGNRGHEQRSGDYEATMIVSMVSHSDLILHQLPYMTMVFGDQVESGQLRRITGLSPFETYKQGHSSDQDEEFAWEAASREHHASNPGNFKDKIHFSHLEPRAPPASLARDEGLILSDDDIVDDP